MSKITVDAENLIMGFENHSDDAEFYLDSETGKVLYGFDGYLTDDDEGLDPDEVDLESERYIWIDGMPSHEGFKLMEDFTEEYTEGEVFESLATVLRGRKPFSNFKHMLGRFPDVREKWFAYEQERMIEYARRWLAEVGVDADLKYRDRIITGIKPYVDEEE